MSKLTKQNVGGTNYTMVGCTLTGVCASAASDFIKAVTLSDGDEASDGMIIACTFANGNTAGIAPGTTTIYSSDQVNYYSDVGLTEPFTLAPSGCYTIEYTGTGNAYTYSSYPVVQVGAVTGPLCASNGIPSGGTAWSAGDTVLLLYTGGKFLAINVVTNTIAINNMQSVTSNAIANALGTSETEVIGGTYFGGTVYKKSFIYGNVSTIANAGILIADNFGIPSNKIVGFESFMVNNQLVADCSLYVQNVNNQNQLCVISPHTGIFTIVATVYYIK